MILEPIDPIHRDSLAAVAEIRRHSDRIAAQIHAWSPQPCPPPHHPTRTENRP